MRPRNSIDPWDLEPDPHADPVAAAGVERDWSGVPIGPREVVTATWCMSRNGYADADYCDDTHVHYDVEYDGNTGKVLTSREEQERRRIEATGDRRLWHEAVYALLHTERGAIYTSVEFLREHPAMQELLRREREKGTTNDWARHPDQPPAAGR